MLALLVLSTGPARLLTNLWRACHLVAPLLLPLPLLLPPQRN
jgi:hypothetical protein